MTSSADPDQIRAEIERTRSNLSSNVDTLAHEADPRTMAKRKVSRVTGTVTGWRERLMGSAQDSTASVADAGHTAAASVTDAAQSAPTTVRRQAQGNPLAAGLVAFGAGLVVAALFPASEKEQQAATTVKEEAQPLTKEVSDVAKDVAGNLQEPAQQAVQSVKDTAADAAGTVKDEGTAAAQDVGGQAQEAKQTVQDRRG